jgi:hypothetical protein
MVAMSPAERAFLDARNLLSQERSKAKAARILQSRGLSVSQATELVDEVFKDNIRTNRRSAIAKILMSAGSLVLFGAIFFFTGHLFFIILPLAGIGFLWGIIKAMTASGWEIDASSN